MAKLRLTLRKRPMGTRMRVCSIRKVTYEGMWFLKEGIAYPYRLYSTKGPIGSRIMCYTQQSTNQKRLIYSKWGKIKAAAAPNSHPVHALCILRMNGLVLSSAARRTSIMSSATWQGFKIKNPRFVISLKQKVRRRLARPSQKHILSILDGVSFVLLSFEFAISSLQNQTKQREITPVVRLRVQWQRGGISLRQSSPPNCRMPESAIPDAKYSYKISIGN